MIIFWGKEIHRLSILLQMDQRRDLGPHLDLEKGADFVRVSYCRGREVSILSWSGR